MTFSQDSAFGFYIRSERSTGVGFQVADGRPNPCWGLHEKCRSNIVRIQAVFLGSFNNAEHNRTVRSRPWVYLQKGSSSGQ